MRFSVFICAFSDLHSKYSSFSFGFVHFSFVSNGLDRVLAFRFDVIRRRQQVNFVNDIWLLGLERLVCIVSVRH